MRLLRRPKKEGWFALTATREGVSLAHVLINGSGKPQVGLCEFRPGALNEAGLQMLSSELGLRNRHCILLLSPADYHFMLLPAPDVPPDEIKKAVRWSIRDRVDFPVEEATLDVLPLHEGNDVPVRYVHAVVASNALIASKQACYAEEAGLGLEAIDVIETAQRNIAHLLEKPGHGLAMLSFNDNCGLLTFTADGQLYHARQIEIPLMQLLGEDEERLSYLFDRIALEVQRSLDSLERQFPRLAIDSLNIAPCPAREAMREFLQNYLGIKIDAFEIQDVFEMKKDTEMLPLETQARLLGVLGAALRGKVR